MSDLTFTFPPSAKVVNSVEQAADTAYSYVITTTKALPDVSPTEKLLKPIIDAGKSKTFILIQVRLQSSIDLAPIRC